MRANKNTGVTEWAFYDHLDSLQRVRRCPLAVDVALSERLDMMAV